MNASFMRGTRLFLRSAYRTHNRRRVTLLESCFGFLDLDRGRRTLPPSTAPEGLLTALADLLLEALSKQNNAIPVEREACDASQDHA